MKKITAIILAVIMSLSLGVTSFAAGFTDIKDDNTLLGAETLRMLGVINGVGDNKFDPDGLLTRAAFCKMTVLIQGRSDQADSYMNRTIFPDVKSTHWARGYINLMASSEKPLLRGFSDGTFRPDTNVTFAQAVTILMRGLGYADTDTDMQWPDGYIELAKKSGLTDGLEGLTAEGYLTRAQAVTLFVNLLNTAQKGGSDYITTLGTIKSVMLFKYENSILYTSEGEYTAKTDVPDCFVSKYVTLVTDTKGKVVTILANNEGTAIKTSLSQIQASWIAASDGKKYTIETATKLYVDGKTQTYSTYWVNLIKGSGAVMYLDKDGKLDILYVAAPSSGSTAIIKSANPLTDINAITKGDTGYTVVRNRQQSSVSEAKQYDVASYNAEAKVLTLTDRKLTGCYENVLPNSTTPKTISVLGNQFEVLDSALNDLSSFNVGDEITVLLTEDNKLAGVLPASVYKQDAIGILSSYTDNKITVKLDNGMTVRGKAPYTQQSLVGGLVIVRSYEYESGVQLSVGQYTGSAAPGYLDVAAQKIGALKLSKNVSVYEKVSNGDPQKIDYEDITQTKVSPSKIIGIHTDNSGEVDLIILDNVTGDLYTYGFIYTSSSNVDMDPSKLSGQNYSVELVNSQGTVKTMTYYSYKNGAAAGILVYDTNKNLAYVAELTKAANISRSAFTVTDDATTAELPGFKMPVSDKVTCYNSKNGTWFASLDEARAYSDKLTVYYDRLPEEGGKIRLIVVE